MLREKEHKASNGLVVLLVGIVVMIGSAAGFAAAAGTERGGLASVFVLILLATIITLIGLFTGEYVVTRIYYIDDLTWADMIFGTLLVVLVLEATRRVIGWALPITAIVFLVYGFFIACLAAVAWIFRTGYRLKS